jgi:transposase
MTKPRKKYTREFKISLIHLIDSGTPLAQVARENGIHPNLVTKWKRQYAKDPNKAFSGNGNTYTAEARIAELERLLGKTYAENEF